MPLKRIYCASPAHRAKLWRTLDFPNVEVISTWHNNPTLEETDLADDPIVCRAAWDRDFHEIGRSDALLVYAEHKDRPNGTLIEIGYALSEYIPVYLVGNFEWGTWRHNPLIHTHPTLRGAITFIATGKNDSDDPT